MPAHMNSAVDEEPLTGTNTETIGFKIYSLCFAVDESEEALILI